MMVIAISHRPYAITKYHDAEIGHGKCLCQAHVPRLFHCRSAICHVRLRPSIAVKELLRREEMARLIWAAGGFVADEQTVAAIIAAIGRFEGEGAAITPEACRKNAPRFAPEHFRTAFVEREWAAFRGIK
jgi:hypothetical protein